ncbi:helix-turn-helix domain-containing protein [Flammeovirga pacifica]|uniref:HTH araC/xylS-type domain-containing protein n=1 Tax=Flammeovirga pacifica TaxID=915059 RepID=A0A1S1Z0P5_FLAPC|nr:helix-turn-helix transcriptional regulator [Flammeovirga pacifica]OHX66839.1 hypothetical protein NH26_10960 [Flammeovirga pacifica]
MIDLLTLRIKNMVCNRCIQAVWNIFEKNDVMLDRVELGVAYLQLPLQPNQKEIVIKDLQDLGFELLDNKQSIIVEKVKNVIHHKFEHLDQDIWKNNLSVELQKEIGMDYSKISTLFSSVEGITIEKYLNHQKIEKVKEFLSYDELTIAQIADILGYSSSQYLSSKFKQSTGLTPSNFKSMNQKPLRKSLDELK